MALFRDDDEERNARVEHFLEHVRRSQAEVAQKIKHAKRSVKRAKATVNRINRTLKRKRT
jgi:hypothetical protein